MYMDELIPWVPSDIPQFSDRCDPSAFGNSDKSNDPEYLAYDKAKTAKTLSFSEVKGKRAARQKIIAMKAQMCVVAVVGTHCLQIQK
jgi:hypothetical protein